ncbi:MAG TPA: hypothetical protein VN642_04420 [Dongiaceae bacterium]|nr:hypothetical protein [Dongiaceae bacterium]
MNAKSTLTAVCSAIILSLTTSTGAFASSGVTNKVFISGPLILLFLGFCALVVVIQCIPAIIMLYGMIKGAASNKEKETVTAKSN